MALHRLTALAVAGALALGLSACGDDSPSPAPSTSSAASSPTPTSASTGPAAPILPDLAARHDAVGAKAFVQFYFSALTYAMKTGDTELVDRYATKDCEACAGISAKVRKIYAPGGRNEGGGWQLRRIDEIGLSKPELRRFVAFVVQPAQTLIDPEGRRGHHEARKQYAFNVWVVPQADGWLLREIQEVPRVN